MSTKQTVLGVYDMQGKKITQSQLIGQSGENLVERIVLSMGYLWYPTGKLEAATDGFIEIRDPITGELTGTILKAQSKAVTNFTAETDAEFQYLCDESDIRYWLQSNIPVILVVSRAGTDEAYWIPVKEYFQDPQARKNRRVHFDKAIHQFDKGCQQTLIDLAVPKAAGVYFSPPPKSEILYSNLLSVSFGDQIYSASTEFRDGKLFMEALRNLSGDLSGDWVLRNKRVLSFRNLAEFPWNELCDVATLEVEDSKKWAFNNDFNTRRDFVQLLNRSLREKIYLNGDVSFSPACSCYYFRPPNSGKDRIFSYRSQKRMTSRRVVRTYSRQDSSDRISYWKHSAFESQFKLYGDCWYLEITPTYFYSTDGYNLHKYHEELRSGIKREERNDAVKGQVIMWARYLQGGLLSSPEYLYLNFGELLTFDVNFGISDDIWTGKEDAQEVEVIQASLDDLPLFGGDDAN